MLALEGIQQWANVVGERCRAEFLFLLQTIKARIGDGFRVLAQATLSSIQYGGHREMDCRPHSTTNHEALFPRGRPLPSSEQRGQDSWHSYYIIVFGLLCLRFCQRFSKIFEHKDSVYKTGLSSGQFDTELIARSPLFICFVFVVSFSLFLMYSFILFGLFFFSFGWRFSKDFRA